MKRRTSIYDGFYNMQILTKHRYVEDIFEKVKKT